MLDVRDVEAIVREAFGGPHVKGFRIREVQFPDSDTHETVRFTGDPLPWSLATDAMYLRIEFVDLDNHLYARATDRDDRPGDIPATWRVWVYAPWGGPDEWTLHTATRVRKRLVVTLGIAKGDSQMDDTVEVTVEGGSVDSADIVYGCKERGVVATFADACDVDWDAVEALRKKHGCDKIQVKP